MESPRSRLGGCRGGSFADGLVAADAVGLAPVLVVVMDDKLSLLRIDVIRFWGVGVSSGSKTIQVSPGELGNAFVVTRTPPSPPPLPLLLLTASVGDSPCGSEWSFMMMKGIKSTTLP
jgi:hypothetical protein